MKTVFKVGMKVYDQVNFPDKEGKVEEIYISEGQEYPIVLFEGKKERVCYNFEGCLSDCITKTLSTKPYKVEFQGFEQKAPARTYEEAVEWLEKNSKDRVIYADEAYINEEYERAFEALKKLVILRDYYNKGWQPNWKELLHKYCVEVVDNYLAINSSLGHQKVLSFKQKYIANKFLEEQRELLEIAKPLL